MDYSKAPRISEKDFTDSNKYYLMTKPMELDVDLQKVEDFWNRGLTGGDSGRQLYNAKKAIKKVVKEATGVELRDSDIEWDTDLNEFVARHPVNRPGDIAKSYWKIKSITQTVRFIKDKRTGSIQGADKYGTNLYSSTASHNYTVEVKNIGVKEY